MSILSENAAALINDRYWGFWSAPAGLGTPAVITYSFLEAAPPDYSAADYRNIGFTAADVSPLPADRRELVRQALSAWASVAGLTFIEVPALLGGDMRVGQTKLLDQGAAGPGFMPLVTVEKVLNPAFGDMYFDVGGVPMQTILHEVGHALGLKHPHDGEPVRDIGRDTSIMGPQTVAMTALQPLDVEAIQYLYGTPADRANEQLPTASTRPPEF
jgi:hypothetical protein